MNVVVSGATGFIGRQLCASLLKQGESVTALARDPDRARPLLPPEAHVIAFDLARPESWSEAVQSADRVIQLAGESIGGHRWTPEVKRRLMASRVDTTSALARAMAISDRPGRALLCASGAGYYGDRGDEVLTESSGPGGDFLADLAVAWEAACNPARNAAVRVVNVRLGIVLGHGGALHTMLYPLPGPLSPWKLGLGGPIGSGRQWMPWIHIDDAVALFVWAAKNDLVEGPINAVSPQPIRNRDFTRALGSVLHRPAIMPLPGFVLRCLVGEFADALLGGQRVIPQRAGDLGFQWTRPDLDAAIRASL